MKAIPPEEMLALEEAAFQRGSSADALMEEAGAQIAHAVRQWFPQPGSAYIFHGKGHNGGDALVAARHLAAAGWTLCLRPSEPDENRLSRLTREKLAAIPEAASRAGAPPFSRPLIVLDGLLGIGAAGPLREPARRLAREINAMRAEQNAHVFAIDVPSGLDAGTGRADADAVEADFTLAIGFPKCGLLADHAANHVGRLAVLPLAQLPGTPESAAGDPGEVSIASELARLLPRRKTESHKTTFGRIGIVAGSVGFTGAALLAAQGALRAGAGLVSLYAPRDIQPTLAAATSPEIMVKPVEDFRELLESKRDVLAVGPGLGTERAEEVLELIARCPEPMVLDADALNILSKGRLALLRNPPAPRLLTPHPGEMARLLGGSGSGGKSRAETVRAFTEEYPVALLLKGARTVIGEKGRPLFFNATGNPGMATGGMGDVLTGVCAALIGQGLSALDAARLGAWLCGRAAELAIFCGADSEESLCAGRVVRGLGAAFKQLRAGCF